MSENEETVPPSPDRESRRPRRTDFDLMVERQQNARAESPDARSNAGHPRPPAPDEPIDFDLLVDYFVSDVREKMKAAVDVHTQHELGLLLNFLRPRNREFLSDNKVLFKTALDLLAADEPNLDLVRQIRLSIQVAQVRHRGGFTGLVVKFCGPGPVTAVLAGLLTTFVALCLILTLVTLAYVELRRHDGSLGELDQLKLLAGHLKLGDLYLLFLASFFGSIVSIVTRMGPFLSYTLHDPLEIFTSVLFRPFIGFSFALFIYAVLRSGFISFPGVDLDSQSGIAVIWIFGFLAGYSERFSKEFVSSAEGTLVRPAGGDAKK